VGDRDAHEPKTTIT